MTDEIRFPRPRSLACLLPAALCLLAALSFPATTPASARDDSAAQTRHADPLSLASLLANLSPAVSKGLLNDLNDLEETALAAIPGIGETRAATIENARPLDEIGELMLLPGFGEKTVLKIVRHSILRHKKRNVPRPRQSAPRSRNAIPPGQGDATGISGTPHLRYRRINRTCLPSPSQL